MSNSETHRQDTQHAFLVAWGWFAEHLGLIQQFQAVSLKQKPYHHRPQTKVLEFLVAILAGLQHLQEISLASSATHALPLPLKCRAGALLHRQNPEAECLVSFRVCAGDQAVTRVVRAVQWQADD